MLLRMEQITRLLFIGFLCASFSLSADARIEQLDIQQPRTFGYKIGDKFERIISLKLGSPFVLDAGLLPKQGRLSEWLNLEKPVIEQKVLDGSTHYRIKLSYQIINIKQGLNNIDVPSHMLVYSDANGDKNKKLNALIPATNVGVSTLTDPEKTDLQVDRTPALLPHSNMQLYLYASLLLISLIGWAYLKWGVPFRTKHHPFANAYLLLSSQRHRRWDDACRSEALQTIHQAFNETAQKTVFVEKLDDFFAEHKRYTPLRETIEAYFTYTRKYFFNVARDQNDHEYSLADLIDLVQQCRDIERGIA